MGHNLNWYVIISSSFAVHEQRDEIISWRLKEGSSPASLLCPQISKFVGCCQVAAVPQQHPPVLMSTAPGREHNNGPHMRNAAISGAKAGILLCYFFFVKLTNCASPCNCGEMWLEEWSPVGLLCSDANCVGQGVSSGCVTLKWVPNATWRLSSCTIKQNCWHGTFEVTFFKGVALKNALWHLLATHCVFDLTSKAAAGYLTVSEMSEWSLSWF